VTNSEWYKKREEKNEKKKNEEDAKGIKKVRVFDSTHYHYWLNATNKGTWRYVRSW